MKQHKFRKRFTMDTGYGLGFMIWLHSELRHAEAYLEPSRTSAMELFLENNQRLLAINYFRKKAPPQSLDWTLNKPLSFDHARTQLKIYLFFFFYLGFLLRTFTNHWTAGKGGGHFFNPSLPLPPASQTLRH